MPSQTGESTSTTAAGQFEPTPATVTPDAQVYTNPEGRFQITLPEGWQVAGPEQVQVMDGASYNLYILGEQPLSIGSGPGESRIIIAEAGQLTVAQFIQAQCPICPEQPITQINLAGVSAMQTVIGGGSVPFEVEWIFIEHAGKLIGFSIHDPETLESLNQVIETIQLL